MKTINVTKSFLPPVEEYNRYINKLWGTGQLTNNGELVRELEGKLVEFSGVPHVLFVSNGTIALQLAIRALGIKGDIITTPFSYVATTSAIVWEGCQPVFVDIDPESLNIDPAKIEESITAKTSAILATHVFGNPCDIEKIQAIADKHKLKVIYDAAHCFGVKYKGKSVFNYGDISIASFHATKVFHTVEGGGLFTNDRAIAEKVRLLRNFGHITAEEIDGAGINAKNSEFHAAMGLSILPYIDEIFAQRKVVSALYDELLDGQNIQAQTIQEGTTYNYAYYPVLLEDEEVLMSVKDALEENNINPRRYFYPSLNTLNYVDYAPMLVSEDIALRILCLPIYPGIEEGDQKRIVEIIFKALEQH